MTYPPNTLPQRAKYCIILRQYKFLDLYNFIVKYWYLFRMCTNNLIIAQYLILYYYLILFENTVVIGMILNILLFT